MGGYLSMLLAQDVRRMLWKVPKRRISSLWRVESYCSSPDGGTSLYCLLLPLADHFHSGIDSTAHCRAYDLRGRVYIQLPSFPWDNSTLLQIPMKKKKKKKKKKLLFM